MLPNFLILGAAKSGTTSLYHVLKQHPQVFVTEKKELHFFVKEHWYRRGMRCYARHFAPARAEHRAVGEATPVYLCHPAAPHRIREHLPEARLIAIVRDPVQRAHSHYWQERRRLNEHRSFDEV